MFTKSSIFFHKSTQNLHAKRRDEEKGDGKEGDDLIFSSSEILSWNFPSLYILWFKIYIIYMQSVEMRTREMEKREMILAETLVWGFSIRFHRHLWYLVKMVIDRKSQGSWNLAQVPMQIDRILIGHTLTRGFASFNRKYLAQGPSPKYSSTSTTSATREFFFTWCFTIEKQYHMVNCVFPCVLQIKRKMWRYKFNHHLFNCVSNTVFVLLIKDVKLKCYIIYCVFACVFQIRCENWNSI